MEHRPNVIQNWAIQRKGHVETKLINVATFSNAELIWDGMRWSGKLSRGLTNQKGEINFIKSWMLCPLVWKEEERLHLSLAHSSKVCICGGVKGHMAWITSITMMTTLMQNNMYGFWSNIYCHLFQGGTCSSHSACITPAWLCSKSLRVLKWPACCSDLFLSKNRNYDKRLCTLLSCWNRVRVGAEKVFKWLKYSSFPLKRLETWNKHCFGL